MKLIESRKDKCVTLDADGMPPGCDHIEIESSEGEEGSRTIKIYPDRIEVHTFTNTRLIDEQTYELPDYFELNAEDLVDQAVSLADSLEDR